MSYSFVWLYLIKCVFTCSIFVDSNTKIFLSVLGVFGKYFILQKLKIKKKKQFYPVLATQLRVSQVACHSRELVGQFWRLVHEWKVQLRGVHRDFRGSARGSIASKTSSREKHLAKIFKFSIWSVLVGNLGDSLATYLNRENCVFCKMSSFSTLFSKRGSHLLVLHSRSVHFLVLLSLIQHHCGNLQSLSPSCYHSIYLQGKVWVLSSTLCFFLIIAFSSWFLCSIWYSYISYPCLVTWVSDVLIFVWF